jgi:HlyD family secretion protein
MKRIASRGEAFAGINAARFASARANASPLLALLVVLAIAGCSSQPIPVKPTPTAAAPGKGIQAGENIVAEGRVTPVKSAALSFSIGGIVTQVPVALGDHVEAGTALARLDDSILQKQIAQAQAQIEIAQKQQAQASAQVELAEKQLAQLKAGGTEADIASAQAALNAANANYAKVKQGPTADELAQLKANLDNAQAARDQAQSAYDRAGGASNPFIAQTRESLQLQQTTNAYNAALGAYNDARSHPTTAELAAAYAQIQQAQDALARLTPTQPALDVAQAQVDSARTAEALAQTQVAAAQAALDTVKAQAANYVLVAPFAGTVMTLDIDAGEYAAPGIEILRLADTPTWQIETTDLTELNIVNVGEGTPVTLTFDAIPGLQLPGKVTNIKPYGESHQGDIVYTVVITPDQQDPRLRWNMTAKVSIESVK